MAVIEEAKRRAAPARWIDDAAELARQEPGFRGGPRAVLAEYDEQAAAALHEAIQDAVGHGGGKRDVVQHDDRVLLELRERHLARGYRVNLERWRRADGQRFGQVQARIRARAALARGVDHHDADGAARRQDEMKDVVAWQRVGAGAHRAF